MTGTAAFRILFRRILSGAFPPLSEGEPCLNIGDRRVVIGLDDAGGPPLELVTAEQLTQQVSGAAANSAAIATEAQARADGDAANAQALTAEAQARADGDAANAQALTAEAQARADGDAGINSALVIEAATRSQADQALAQQISTANESRLLRPDRAYTAPPDPNICPRWREISSGGLPLYDYYWVWVPQISRWASEVPLWLSASSGRLTQRESEGNLTGPILGLETWLGTGTLVVSKHTGAYNFALRRYTRYDNVRSTLITKNLPRTVGNSTPETFSLEINQILPLGYWRLTWAMDIDPSAGANQQQDAGISVSLPLRLLRP